VEIIFQSHHATISPFMRERAERGVQRIAARLARAVDAQVRFETDGPARRVEIVLHAPRHQDVRAEGSAPRFAGALSQALRRLDAQTSDPKRRPRTNPLKTASIA
jgi:ribosome-associated translation inhibitor RaiA